jgi:hypothetical protein
VNLLRSSVKRVLLALRKISIPGTCGLWNVDVRGISLFSRRRLRLLYTLGFILRMMTTASIVGVSAIRTSPGRGKGPPHELC